MIRVVLAIAVRDRRCPDRASVQREEAASFALREEYRDVVVARMTP